MLRRRVPGVLYEGVPWFTCLNRPYQGTPVRTLFRFTSHLHYSSTYHTSVYASISVRPSANVARKSTIPLWPCRPWANVIVHSLHQRTMEMVISAVENNKTNNHPVQRHGPALGLRLNIDPLFLLMLNATDLYICTSRLSRSNSNLTCIPAVFLICTSSDTSRFARCLLVFMFFRPHALRYPTSN